MKHPLLVVICAGAPCLVGASSANAGVTPVGLWRTASSTSIARHVGIPAAPDSEYTYLPQFGAFTPLSIVYQTGQSLADPPVDAWSQTRHDSTPWSPQRLTATGTGAVHARIAESASNTQAQALAGSALIYGFVLDQPTRASVRGILRLDAAGADPTTAAGFTNSYLYRIVNGQAEYLFDHQYSNSDIDQTINFAGILPAGEYRFAVSFSLNASPSAAGADEALGAFYEAEILIPAPSALPAAFIVLLFGRIRRMGRPRRPANNRRHVRSLQPSDA